MTITYEVASLEERPAFPPHKLRLYQLLNKACPYAQRVDWLLRALNLDFEVFLIDAQNKPKWYHLVNPRSKVPALETPDGDVFIESQIILWYLLEKYHGPLTQKVLPDDPIVRYNVRLLLSVWDEKVGTAYFQAYQSFGPAGDPSKREQALANYHNGLKELSAAIKGPLPLFVTIAIYPWFYRAKIFPFGDVKPPTSEEYNNLQNWLSDVEHSLDDNFQQSAITHENYIALLEKIGFKK